MNNETKYMEKYKEVISDLRGEISNRIAGIEKCEAVLNDGNIGLDMTTIENLKNIIAKNKEVVAAISNILKKYEEV